MSETTCPHCDVEMTMHGVACLGNPSTNGILYCCPVCTYKIFLLQPERAKGETKQCCARLTSWA